MDDPEVSLSTESFDAESFDHCGLSEGAKKSGRFVDMCRRSFLKTRYFRACVLVAKPNDTLSSLPASPRPEPGPEISGCHWR